MGGDAREAKGRRHRGPETITIPLGKAVTWARYISGAAVLVCAAQYFVVGVDEDVSREGLLDPVFLPPGYDSAELTGSPYVDVRWSDGMFDEQAGRALSGNSTPNAAQQVSGAGVASSHGSSSAGSSSAGRCGGHSAAGKNSLGSTLAFLFSCFFVCTVIDHCNLFVPFEWRFPISVMMFLVGGAFGVFFIHVTHLDSDNFGKGFDLIILGMQGASHFDPHALLYIVLPPLLYESACSMDWHVLRKILPSALLLAVPGVMLNTFLTGCFVQAFVKVGDERILWGESWLLGSILSATDPVAVVAALAALGAPKKLSSLVEGESLLNDGSAVVCAYVFLDWSSSPHDGKYCNTVPPKFGCMFQYFMQVAVGGTFIGLAVGAVMFVWIKLARQRLFPALELAIVMTAVYGTFFVAEAFKTSGVLADVALGFLMSAGLSKRMSHEGRHNHHVILGQVGYFCNQVAFFVAGIVSSRFMKVKSDRCDHTAQSFRAWAELFGLYACIHVTRSLVVLCFWPLLKRMGYGINWKEACIMVYGGLRGAVGLVMGLIVEHNHYMKPDIAQMIAFHTSGIVLLTLFINGSTIDGLYKRLNLYPSNGFREIHLRKSFIKVEAECQKAGIRAICNDWFFKSCNFKKMIRCVPNFSHIQFDAAGVPHPENIEDAKTTLRNLASDASLFRLDPNGWRDTKSFDNDFAVFWRKRKMESEQVLTELMNAPTQMTERKDSLINVRNTGETIIEYRPPDAKALAGFYVSSRTMASLMLEDDDDIIEFRISRMEKVVIAVGLIASDDEVGLFGDSLPGQVLGLNFQNSIAFNCSTCVLSWSGPLGMGEVQAERPGLEDGEVVCIQVGQKKTLAAGAEAGCYDITFSVRQYEGAPVSTVMTCSFGPFSAAELYPVVEFRHLDETRMLKNQRSGNKLSMIPGTASQFTLVNSVAEASSVANASVSSSLNAVMEVSGAFFDNVKQGITGGAQRGEGATEGGGDADKLEKGTSKRSNPSYFGKVALSFEPQLASDSESINELFHVLFNTVMHFYTDMHEHGILGDTALSWLSEAVGAGMDCANFEVNARRAADFQMISGSTSKFISESSNSSSNHDLEIQQTGSSLSAVKRHSTEIQPPNPPSMRMKSVFSEMRSSSAAKAKIVGLFEPLVVEYLSLENEMAQPSMWDRFPLDWEKVRMIGYGSTRAKAECLWAYVEAHEKVLKESVCMCRFPDLVRCIQTLVGQAKDDLAILEEIQPLRLYYSKHTLALRVLLNRRLAKVRKFTKEGWISAGDAKGLEEALWERIQQADSFNPLTNVSWLHRKGTPGGTPNASSSMSKSLSMINGGGNNAWADLDLPSIVPVSPMTTCMTPVHNVSLTPRASMNSAFTPVRQISPIECPDSDSRGSSAKPVGIPGVPGAIEIDSPAGGAAASSGGASLETVEPSHSTHRADQMLSIEAVDSEDEPDDKRKA